MGDVYDMNHLQNSLTKKENNIRSGGIKDLVRFALNG
jgi:hypothetical protein